MAQSTEFHDRTVPEAFAPGESLTAGRRFWKKAKHIAVRSVLWSYERGSWQYDLICAFILAFIFLTPASWFHDRPTLGLTDLRHTQGVIQVGHAPDGWHYLIDARLVTSMAPLKPHKAVLEILKRRLRKPLSLKSVVALRDRNGVILGYTVVVTR